jgi:hypothetical protein
MRERYQKIRSDILSIQNTAQGESRDLTEDELRSVRSLAEEGKALTEEINDQADHETRSAAVSELAAKLSLGTGPQTGTDPLDGVPGRTYPTAPALVPDAGQLAELHRAAANRQPVRMTVKSDPWQTRAALALSDAGDAPAIAPGGVTPGTVRIAELMLSERVNGYTQVNYPVFASETAHDPTAEAGTKPEGAGATGGQAQPQTLARWKTVSNQTLLTYSNFQTLLTGAMTTGLVKDENALIVATLAAATGTLTHTAATGEAAGASILAGIAAIMDGAGAPVDAIVCHPTDLPTLMAGAVTGSQVNPTDNLPLSLYGARVVPSSAATAGTVWVGAFRIGSRWIVGQSPEVLVDPYTDLKTNQTTVRVEEAVALALPLPSAFCKVTLATEA